VSQVSKGEHEMHMFTTSVFINRSPQRIFDFLSNPVNFERWMPLMQSTAWTSSGEPGVGTTGRGIMKMAGREMELLLEVTRWDVPGRLGFKILIHAPDRNTAQCDATVTGANHPVAYRGHPRTYLNRRIAARNSRAAPC